MKKIYLAGPISGLTYDDAQDWRNKFSAAIDYRIECFSPLRGKDYLTKQGKLEGSYDEFPLFTDQGITTRDRYDCMGADLVVFYMPVSYTHLPSVHSGAQTLPQRQERNWYVRRGVDAALDY